MKLSISWAARTRGINGPSSAQSALVNLANAGEFGGDFTFALNRLAPIGAHTDTYTSPIPAKVGTWPLSLKFYAGQGATGALVATASAQVTIKSDGTGIGDVAVIGKIVSTTVSGGQTVNVGGTSQLIFTNRDLQGNLVSVTPGSATWAVNSGAAQISISPDGIVSGVAPGIGWVTATVDGKKSAAVPIQVIARSIKLYGIAAVGTPNPPSTNYPTWINNHGDICGYQSTSIAPFQTAFLVKNGTLSFLTNPHNNENYIAAGVNDSDVIIGFYGGHGSPLGTPAATVFFWNNGVYSFPDTATGDLLYPSTTPRVNQAGQFLRTVVGNDSIPHAFLTTNGADVDLMTLGGTGTAATSLSDYGQAVGLSAKSGNSVTTPFIYQSGGIFALAVSGLIPTSINAGSQIVGDVGLDQHEAVLVSFSGAAKDIGMVSGLVPHDLFLNNAGQIVATIGSNVISPWHGVIYQNGVWTDLNTMIPNGTGWVLNAPTGINDKGQIVGIGTLNGNTAGFVLTPTS